MTQVLNITTNLPIFTGYDNLAIDLLKVLGLDEPEYLGLLKRVQDYELRISQAGNFLNVGAWAQSDLTSIEASSYNLSLIGQSRLETSVAILSLLGLETCRGVVEVILKVAVGQIATLTVVFEPRRAVESIKDYSGVRFNARKVEDAKIT